MNGAVEQTSAAIPVSEPDTAPISERFSRFASFLTAAYRDLGLQAASTPQHCAKLERLFVHMQAQVQECIDLEQSVHLSDQRVLCRLRVLHRSLIEAAVVVRGVSGLCAIGRHIAEPSGAFWQLVECVRDLRQDCQVIARRCVAPLALVPTPARASA